MVAPARSPKAILQNIKLLVTEKQAIIMATDSEVGIRIEVPGIEVTTPGEVILPVARFGLILRESTDEKLQLESDGVATLVRGQRSEFRLSAENPDEFPEVPGFDAEKYHEVPARLMKELVRRTLFATDTESSRYALGGVLIEFHDDSIIAVGTDGRRLAKMQGPAHSVAGHLSGESTTIVPSRAMHLIERALSDADAEIQLSAKPNELILQTPRAIIHTRLVEGRFPKWEDVVVERPGGVVIEITVGPLFAAVRQAAIVTSDESRGIDFTFGAGSLVLSVATAEIGQSRIELPIAYDGDEIKIALDHRFVSDFLKVIDAEKSVSLHVKDNENPADFRTDDGYQYVVMPLSKEAPH
jgi:DNA polymerase-3 subunit beta